MKRILALIGLLLLTAWTATAQTTTTVTATVKDLSGSVVPTGQVTFDLKPGLDTTISGNSRFTPQTIVCTINQSQSFSATGLSRNNGTSTVTVTFTSPHAFVLNDVITVAGMADVSFNGTFTVATNPDNLHITYTQAGTTVTTGGGYISALRANPGPGSCTVTQNTALTPANTSYTVCLWPSFSRTSCFNWYALSNPVDLSAVVPTPSQMPAYSFIDLFSNQNIGGVKTFTAGIVTVGSDTLSGGGTTGGSWSHSGFHTFNGGLFSSGTNPAVQSPNAAYLNFPVNTNTFSQVNCTNAGFTICTPGRFDLNATKGGTFDSSQTVYPAVFSNVVMSTKGQAISHVGYVKGLGNGNVMGFNFVGECWGGGLSSPGLFTPQCTGLGEIDIRDGSYTVGKNVFQASVTGAPSTGATVISYTGATNESVLGERYLLNKNHKTTTGTVASIASASITFTGASAPAWDAAAAVCDNQGAGVHCNPIGQYIKIGSTNDLYAPGCSGDDVQFDSLCVGHWYRVLSVTSTTIVVVEHIYDSTALTNTFPASYMLVQGAIVSTFDTTAKTVTIPANSYSWANSDLIYSPPNHLTSLTGVNINIFPVFKSGYFGPAQRLGFHLGNNGTAKLPYFFQLDGGAAGVGFGIQIVNRQGGAGLDLSSEAAAAGDIRLNALGSVLFGNVPLAGVGGNRLNYNSVNLVTASSPDVLTNKTLDTAGAGNVLKVNGRQLTAVTGTSGALVTDTSPNLITPAIGVATATSLAINGGTIIAKYYVVAGAITPAQTNANTCAEQTFTPAAFSGVINASDNVFITTSATMAANGVFPVLGLRAVTNGVAITYCNSTAGNLTAPAVTITVTGTR